MLYPRYRTRWLQLGLFSFLSMTNAMLWITFAPIAGTSHVSKSVCRHHDMEGSDLMASFYGVNTFAINCFSLNYMVLYLLLGFWAAQIIEQRSLRSGLLVGASLNALGALVRTFPWPFVTGHHQGATGFAFAMGGQTLASGK